MDPEWSSSHLQDCAILSVSWARIISTPYRPISLKFILILSSHRCRCLPSGLFSLQVVSWKPCINFVCLIRATCHASLILSDFITPIMFDLEHKSWKLLTLEFSPVSCYLLPLRPQYFHPLPVLEHLQFLLFPSV